MKYLISDYFLFKISKIVFKMLKVSNIFQYLDFFDNFYNFQKVKVCFLFSLRFNLFNFNNNITTEVNPKVDSNTCNFSDEK